MCCRGQGKRRCVAPPTRLISAGPGVLNCVKTVWIGPHVLVSPQYVLSTQGPKSIRTKMVGIQSQRSKSNMLARTFQVRELGPPPVERRSYLGPGGARNPLQTSSPPLSPGKRCGAMAQSALGWYRPSVGVPETLDGRPSGVLV